MNFFSKSGQNRWQKTFYEFVIVVSSKNLPIFDKETGGRIKQ